ncbi:MAG TPA: hypothetical protein VKN76_14705, partial [Kiloniellaceae bacterium]|nr:hypothetical protein [Kiloniellaceae bacterium]
MPKIESGVRARALSMKRTARRLPVGPFRTALLAGGCAAVLLSFSPEPLRAAWPEKFCETIKLQTTVAYFRCLTNVYKRANRRDRESNLEDAIEACDGGFDRGFDVAEALGDCGPVGGPATLREQIRAQVLQNVAAVTANAGCQNLSITTDEAASCLVGTTTTAIDLATLLDQLNEQGEDVDETTRIYIQAWGGSGSHGNTSNGGSGAKGGYAQLVTTVGDIVAGSGSALLYYYLGLNGTVAANAGGDGGTASIVALDDLTETAATESNVLLLAGGGGGGGAGRGKDICGDFDERIFGGNGGEGGEAFAETGATVVKAGGDGSAADGITGVSGDGGSTAARGTGGKAGSPGSALAGDNDMAPVGGAGGNHTPASV